MARDLFKSGAQLFGDNWTTSVIKLVLVDYALYTLDTVADRALDDIPAGARVAVSSALTGKTNVDGVLDADPVTLSAVTGATVEAVIAFVDTGVESTSTLLGVWDSSGPGETGLPLTPNGSDVLVTFSNGVDKVINLDT